MIGWFTILPSASFAQRPQYDITATLDTSAWTLKGAIRIAWTNTADAPLDSIGIHLWPNAYADKRSAFGEQTLNLDNLEFFKSKPEQRGGLSDIEFYLDDQVVHYRVDPSYNDIEWIFPSTPIAPGQTISLFTPFTLRVPESFSRMGRTDDSYQFTQWYPHIAVFEDNQWRTMPYLDQGEYYNDFADYKVSLTVPAGYSIAATGILESKSTDTIGSTWNFYAENVIDFAWFASYQFTEISDSVYIDSKSKVAVQLYLDPPGIEYWTNAVAYAKRALVHYSDWLGTYPYPQMSVVHAPWSKGGYMEYPMVAQMGYTSDTALLDITIAHEIGHTWLYGILASNERAHHWMDEGLNTFIENQYRKKYQPAYKEVNLPKILKGRHSMDDLDALLYRYKFEGRLQPPQADPEPQVDDQYYLSAYLLPSIGLEMIMDMLGEDMMKEMLRQYYADYKFTHVSPADLQLSFETTCKCDLTWFFDDWIHRAETTSYQISQFSPDKKEISITNKGGAQIPVKISTYQDGEKIKDHWINGFGGEKTLHLDERFDEVHLYDGMMGVNRVYTANIKPRAILPRIALLPKVESYSAPTLCITPVFGYNLADGFMPGIAFSSGWAPQHRFKWIAATMYGLESKKLRGFATLRYIGDMQQGPFDKWVLSLGLDDFGYQLDTHYQFRDHYIKWEPTIAFRSKSSAQRPHLTTWWKYRYVHIDQHYGRGINYEQGLYEDENRNYSVHELLYQLRSDFVLRPFEALANVQAGNGFVRLNLQYKQQFAGKTKHMGTWVRGYAGWLPVYDQPDANVLFTFNGIASNGYFSKDYMFDQWLGGRNAESGIFSHQTFERDAHLKTLSTVGIGEEWMIGAGVSHAFPFRFLHIYMDAALFPSAITSETQFSYSGGAALVLWKDVFEVYLPILESNDIRESSSYDVRDLWFERISFKANIKFLNPINRIDRQQLDY